MKHSITSTPRSRAWSMAPAASPASMANGFSQRMCLPASAALRTHSAWRWFGRGM